MSCSRTASRTPIAVDEASRIVVEAAEGAPAALHALGILHRDVKPSNIILVTEGEHAHPKLIDLGFASVFDEPKLTAHGVVLGSPIYVAPEYARGEALTPSSDVYSLGVVLFEMLTGQRPFSSTDPHLVLARVVSEDAPRVRTLRPELIDRDRRGLVARCLARQPPRCAFRVPTEFAAAVAFAPAQRSAQCGLCDRSDKPREATRRPTRNQRSRPPAPRHTEKSGSSRRSSLRPTKRRIAPPRRIAFVLLAANPKRSVAGAYWLRSDSNAVSAMSPIEAVRTATGAVRTLADGTRVGLALGRAVLYKSGPQGEVIQCAVEAFMNAQPGEVRVDSEIARMVEEAFELRGDERGTRVVGYASSAWRPALTPLIGRERELEVVTRVVTGACEQRSARSLVVVGAPGMGKTRLVADAYGDLRKTAAAPGVLLVRGDPSRREVPLAALARAHYEALPGTGARALDDLASLIRRLDAISLKRWLGERLQQSPQWIVADDIRWIDDATLALLGELMLTYRAMPLVWTALCRPESLARVTAVAPSAAQLPLLPLSPFACGQWMTAWHADALDDAARRTIVSRAGGNPRFLEELVRAALARRTDDLPIAIHASVQAQIDSLEPAARDGARAASVFGDVFWLEGLEALQSGIDAPAAVAKLVALGVVVARSPSRLVSFTEYGFQHGVFRDAAYATLTLGQREACHRRAAEWLEQSGEDDPSTLANHWQRAGDVPRSLKLHAQSARRSVAQHNYEAAYAQWTCVLAVDDDARSRFEHLLARADVALELSRGDDAERDSHEAMTLAGRDAARRLQVALRLAQARHLLGRPEDAEQVLQAALAEAEKSGVAERYRAEAILRGAHLLAQQGRAATALTMARAVLDDPSITDDDLAPLQPLADQVVGLSTVALGHFDDALATYRAASRRAHRRGDRTRAIAADISVGFVCNQLGLYAEAESILRAARDAAEQFRLLQRQGYAVHNLGLSIARRGDYAAALQAEDDALAIANGIGAPRLAAGAKHYTALLLSERRTEGDAARAHAALDSAEPLVAAYAPLRAMSLASAGGSCTRKATPSAHWGLPRRARPSQAGSIQSTNGKR